jgi:hypothetical protein
VANRGRPSKGSHTALFTSDGQLLGDLAAIDSASALRRRLSHYAAPALLIIDEVGYLSYSNAEVIAIDGDSYRLKEATERADQRARQRRAPSS